MKNIWWLLWKEFLMIWQDPKSRFILIAPPILQLFLFAFAATLDVKNVSIGILNRDVGEQSIELTERFYGSPIFTNITFLHSVSEMTPYIENQKGVMVLSIDPQFSKNLDQRKTASLQLIFDGRKSNTTQIVAGYANTIISQFANDVARKKEIFIEPIGLRPRYWFNPNQLYNWFTVPGLLGILMLVEAAFLSAIAIAREKELGTFDQLLVSPIRSYEILIGKAIPALVIALIEGTFILLAAVFIFQIPFTGSVFWLYVSSVAFTLATVGIGLFLSALCSNQQQAFLSTFAILSPSTLLSGFATPIENMPDWMQTITYIVPLRYFLTITRGIFLKELPTSMILHNLWPMILIACFTLSTAHLFFRRKTPSAS
jgi:ABC-2 type transport system permease protein